MIKSKFATFLLIALLISDHTVFSSSFELESGLMDSTKTKYRRSSLELIIIETDDFPQKDVVLKAYSESPFPDKYNNHSVEAAPFIPANYQITDEERAAAGILKSAAGKMLAGFASEGTGGIIDSTKADMPVIISKYIKQNHLANKMVARWFNRRLSGSMDNNLLSSRGEYDLSSLDASVAKSSVQGLGKILADAGDELINNTFLIFTKLKFLSNEPIAAVIRDAAKAESAANISNEMLLNKAYKLADKLYEKTKEGYSVWTTAYLYKLVWDDSTSAVFYQDYWVEKPKVSDSFEMLLSRASKIKAFDTTSLFRLEYLGNESAKSIVTFSLSKGKRTDEQIITLATVRNVDAVYAKLQKKYEVFKPKVPLFTGYPITAKIGLKEGLEGGEKFEVLEQTMDQKTGRTQYVRKGIIKVDEKLLWDNRFNIDEPDSMKTLPVLDRTTFKGGKDYYSGMLIREIK